MEGALQAARAELDLVRRQAEQWERQATHLTRKHQAVDKAVYEQLQVDNAKALAQLAEAQTALSDARAAAAAAAASAAAEHGASTAQAQKQVAALRRALDGVKTQLAEAQVRCYCGSGFGGQACLAVIMGKGLAVRPAWL